MTNEQVYREAAVALLHFAWGVGVLAALLGVAWLLIKFTDRTSTRRRTR